MNTPRLTFRLDFADGARLGPGKIALMEQIAAHGSISAAARAMDMSWGRAWNLAHELNRMFDAPLIEARPGGSAGGGARLTDRGETILAAWHILSSELGQRHQDLLAQLGALRAEINTIEGQQVFATENHQKQPQKEQGGRRHKGRRNPVSGVSLAIETAATQNKAKNQKPPGKGMQQN